MKVFVTSATGWVGSGVTRLLLEGGHEVTALVRSEASEKKAKEAGAKTVFGDLEKLDVLKEAAKAADAVIHTAFIHDFARYAECVAIDKAAVSAILDSLSGSGKTFVLASGLLGTGDEDTLPPLDGFLSIRGAVERLVLERGEKEKIRIAVMRLPPSVHGVGEKGFVPMLHGIAKAKGVSAYVDEGDNRWAAVHRDDAARAFVLAMTKGPDGQRAHAVAEPEGVRLRDIAEAIGKQLDIPVKSISGEDAVNEHFGGFAGFVSLTMTSPPTTLTQERLGWKPEARSLLDDIADPAYFA
ncbi:Cholesterol dehydrogenase [Hondaea fermentalgiana]|uniref:Cholesterol dehydrogenase n=1 Tax=Hondaea fermentalgiana TaxID=2315210 RepID=A0A2R5GJ12_9STRA|nr:Cholesterol dehydrogenase [Hondaea fermentalgiana]|eukprot:GBG28643.1 Cholesterol dehydrogenase [Hondaea fermentalgiana]